MNIRRTLVVLCMLTPASSMAELPSCLLGRWRSNEELTLNDMRQHPEVTAKARALFENRFFGRLVIVNTPTLGGGYMEPEQDRESLVLEPFQVVTSTATSAVIRTNLMGTPLDTEWFCEGRDIYALVSKWKFREYFSPE